MTTLVLLPGLDGTGRLIGPWHAGRIRHWHPATRVLRLRGPHFLLQARPAEAATAIRAFVRDAPGTVLAEDAGRDQR